MNTAKNEMIARYEEMGYRIHSIVGGGQSTVLIKFGHPVESGVLIYVDNSEKIIVDVLTGPQIGILLKEKKMPRKKTVKTTSKKTVKTTSKNPKKPVSLRSSLRNLFASGKRFTIDALESKTGKDRKAVMGMLSDLKNPKYAGKEGPLKITSIKNIKNVMTYGTTS